MIRIKICGLQDTASALAAAEAGADAIGLVFAPSKRKVQPAIAREICKNLPALVNKVGVFVDEEAAVVKDIAAYCGLDTLQFHGRESAEYCSQFSQPVIKAFPIQDKASLAQLNGFETYTVLLDSYSAGCAGGTGCTFSWQLVELAGRKRIILAGGLSAANVVTAIRTVRPYGVDVSSGVETDGKKDIRKIKEFITTIRRWQYCE